MRSAPRHVTDWMGKWQTHPDINCAWRCSDVESMHACCSDTRGNLPSVPYADPADCLQKHFGSPCAQSRSGPIALLPQHDLQCTVEPATAKPMRAQSRGQQQAVGRNTFKKEGTKMRLLPSTHLHGRVGGCACCCGCLPVGNLLSQPGHQLCQWPRL